LADSLPGANWPGSEKAVNLIHNTHGCSLPDPGRYYDEQVYKILHSLNGYKCESVKKICQSSQLFKKNYFIFIQT